MPFNAVAQPMNETLLSIYDWDKAQIANQLFRSHGYQGEGFLQLFRSLGRQTPVANDSWSAYEDNRIIENITNLNNVADPGAGNSADITLSPSDLDASNNFYPRVGFIFTIPVTEVQAYISAIDVSTPTAPVLTLLPVDSTQNIGAIAAGTVLSITNGAAGAGTGQPLSAQRGATKRDFKAQIFKETITAEGTQLVTEQWFAVYDSGENIIGWYNLAFMDMEYRIQVIEDGAYCFGQDNTNTNLVVPAGQSGAGNAIKTTKGIVPWIREIGNVDSYTPGAWAVTDLDDIDLYLEQQGVTSPYVMFLQGTELAHEVENALVDYNVDTGVDWTRQVKSVFGGDEELALDVRFSEIRKGHRSYLMKRMSNFSNPKTFGATGYTMTKYGMLCPLSKVKDTMTGEKLDNLASRYREFDGYSRKYEVWNVSGAGKGLKTTDLDLTNTYIRTHHGLQAMKVNQMTLLDPN